MYKQKHNNQPSLILFPNNRIQSKSVIHRFSVDNYKHPFTTKVYTRHKTILTLSNLWKSLFSLEGCYALQPSNVYSPHFLCRKLYNGYYVNINDLLTLAMKYLQKVFQMGKDKNENEKGRPFSVILFFGIWMIVCLCVLILSVKYFHYKQILNGTKCWCN